jgi:hypothetical protein
VVRRGSGTSSSGTRKLLISPFYYLKTRSLVPIPFIPDPNHSANYNSGFRQGYEGIPLKYHHTDAFLTGYRTGSESYWSNRGQVESENGMSPTSKNPWYLQGYEQGKTLNGERRSIIHTLPTSTADNYIAFYIGYYDGATQADSDNSNDKLGYYGCPFNDKEFCQGFMSGYKGEEYLIKEMDIT